MTAVTPTTVQEVEIAGTHVMYPKTGAATERALRLIYIAVTSTAVDNTLDVNTYAPCTGIAGIQQETLDGAINGGTFNTWSGTTITTAGHAGSGVWQLFVWVY